MTTRILLCFSTLLLVFLPTPQADITISLTATSRQIIATYTAPDTGACTVEASESNTYSPVITDVNSTLFSGSNIDSRSGSLGTGTTSRSFIIGTVPDMRGVIANVASDGKRYGRALQPLTTYYVRVTCGSHTGTASVTTLNRPLGMTRGNEQPIASAGTYAFPTSNESDRTQTLIDPVTGIKLRKLTAPSDDTVGGNISMLGSGAPWPFAQSTINDSHGVPGYLWAGPTEGGSARLYFVTDTASRFLGTIRLSGGSLAGFPSALFLSAVTPHFGIDPTQLFYIARDGTDQTGNAQVIRCQLPASGDTVYDTSAVSGAFAPCNFTNLTSSNSLKAQLQAFDATWDQTSFGNFANQVVQGNYLLFTALRGNQDSYGWVGAVDLSTLVPSVAGFAPLWQRGGSGALSFRWCSIHTSHPALGTSKMSFTAKTMYQSGVGMGPYTTNLSGAMTNVQTTVTFTSNTPTSPNPDTTLYAIAAGDEIQIDNEIMYLGSNTSGTTWNVTRGQAGTVAASHSSGASALMSCRCHSPNDFTQAGPSWWDFVADPHATDTTGTNLITQLANSVNYAGHEGFANGRGLAEGGWEGFIGAAGINNTILSISDSAAFAGAVKSASGNAWQKHPGASQQTNADSGQSLVWGADFLAEDADVELRQTSFTVVTGSLWKYANSNYSLQRKKLAMLAIAGAKPLLDISSTATGDVIGGLSGDNYKYCVANAANECRSGSLVGDVYINAPGLTGSSTCINGNTDYSNTTALCFGNFPAYGSMVEQIGIVEANSTGKWIRGLTFGNMPVKVVNVSSDAHTSPDGKWMAFYYLDPSGVPSIWLARIPSWPGYDGNDRNTFIQRSVNLSGPALTSTVLLKFGYDTSLNCTSRTEACVSAQANNPYYFASETFTRLSCAGGSCSASVPVIPDRVAYVHPLYYDAGGSLLSTGAMIAVTDGLTAQTGGVKPTGKVSVRGGVRIGP